MSQHNVSAEFIKQAHAAACSEWKKKIQEQFPSLFPTVFEFGIEPLQLSTFSSGKPVMLANDICDGKYRGKALLVSRDWVAEIIQDGGHQLIQFKPKS